jgi:PE-PPE domain/PE family
VLLRLGIAGVVVWGNEVSFVIVNADVVAAAAKHLANIGATISDANAAAAALTTKLVPAAEDEISEAVAGLFGTSAQDFHALAARAAAFPDRFMQAVNASAGSYVAAESASAAALFQIAQQDLLGVLNAPTEALLGRPLIATGTGMPTVASQVVQLDAAGIVSENAYLFGSGVYQLTFNESVSNGVQILDATIQQELAQGNTVNVLGYSQSAVVATLEMAKLQAEGVPSSAVSFTIIGDPMNPNGGLLERFAGLQLPSLGISFSGATPSNAYPTTVYTIEYDGWADFPRYPLDILSDLNVLFSDSHFYYHLLSVGQIDGAIPLPTSGPTMTTYYMVPGPNLPLLNPIRGIAFIGNPIGDLLQPDLTYLVNLGYGDPRYGWSTGPANVPTPAGLLPPLSAFELLPGLLASGTQLGIHNFVGDLNGTGPNPVALPSLSSLTSLLDHPSSLLTSLLGASSGTTSGSSLTSLLYPSSGTASGMPAATPLTTALSELLTLAADPPAALTYIANTISSAASGLYSKLLPTADILNAALINIPSYDVNLFLDGILQAVNGQPVLGLTNAIGQPIASDIALYLWLVSLESAVLTNPVELAGPATGVPGLGLG